METKPQKVLPLQTRIIAFLKDAKQGRLTLRQRRNRAAALLDELISEENTEAIQLLQRSSLEMQLKEIWQKAGEFLRGNSPKPND